MRMEDQVDAILWMGVTRPPTPVAVIEGDLRAIPAYLPMRLARIAVAGLPRARPRP